MLTMYNNKCDFQQSDCTAAVLPIGALEQHGSHLPVGTDTMISNEVASRIAAKLAAYLLPALPISCSIEHRETKGTVYIKAMTLYALIEDIAESLEYSGFKKLYVINGHGGNWIIKQAVREVNRKSKGLDVVLLSSQSARGRMLEVMEHAVPPDIHAGETETSLMLHLHETHVGQIRSTTNKEFPPQDYLDYFDITELTEDGYWGFPECATADKGKRWLDLVVEVMLEQIQHIEEIRRHIED